MASKPIIINNMKFDNIKSACKYYNINYCNVIKQAEKTHSSIVDTINYYINSPVRTALKAVEVNGEHFDSIKLACEKYNINYGTVLSAMKRTNNTVEEIINNYRLNGIKAKQLGITIDGKHYDSIKSACQDIGIDYETMYRVMSHRGLSIEQSIEYCKHINKKESIMVFNKQFVSIKEACKYFNVNYDAVLRRTRETSDSLEQSITYYKTYGVKSVYNESIVHGVKYRSRKDVAQAYGITETRLKSVMKRLNCSMEQAVDYCVEHKISIRDYNVTINGKHYSSLTEISKDIGVNSSTLLDRMKSKNETLEQSVSHYINNGTKDTYHNIVVNNIAFSCLTEACKYYNVQTDWVKYRTSYYKCTPEEAINYYIENGKQHTIKPLTVSGIKYKSLLDFQKVTGNSGSSEGAILEQLISKGYIQQLDGTFLRIV